MDGIHDLGGKQGFGAIDIDDPNVVFHHDWEARQWGISRSLSVPNVNIDWWRHCRELIQAEDYLNRPYFDSWSQTDLATCINAGLVSLEEVKACQAEKQLNFQTALGNEALANNDPVNKSTILQADRNGVSRFDQHIEVPVLYAVGQSIITNRNAYSGHTRLPQYVRGCVGVVEKIQGAHVFPDLSSKGEKQYQHLYSIKFQACDLWPSDNLTHQVFLDLWESYLLSN